MLCPACRTDNFEGEDSCSNCGADLRTRDIPQGSGDPRGIFADRDAVLKVAGLPGPAPAIGEVMTPDPVVLDREATVAVAINKMAMGGFRHIPIVEGADRDRPVGVVVAADLFHHLVAPRP
jgi:CBS domain-containing protein